MSRRVAINTGAGGSTDLYAVVEQARTGKLWQTTGNAFIDLVNDEWDGVTANVDLPVTEYADGSDSDPGWYYCELPDHAAFIGGKYIVRFYQHAGTPSVGDSAVGAWINPTHLVGERIVYFDGEEIVDDLIYDVLVSVVRNGSNDYWVLMPRKNGKPLTSDDIAASPTIDLQRSPDAVALISSRIPDAQTIVGRRWYSLNEPTTILEDNTPYAGMFSCTIHETAQILPFVVQRIA